MSDRFEHCYIRDDALRLWRRQIDVVPFAYSDGDDNERYIHAAVAGAADVSTGSPELAAAIRDWPSQYHLDPRRPDLLRHLAPHLRGRTLEVGCGCGAITRFLGELGGSVLAVEGSLRRARIAAERCRDIDNVHVIADTFQALECDGDFDVVTLIGVLEYSRMYFCDIDPVAAMLRRCRAFLKPDGVLILAIENQLGLKYFAGAPEDHLGKPFAGINDIYGIQTAVTFGQTELTRKLQNTGFTHQAWYYPFPDYKLPVIVLSEAAIRDHSHQIGNILIACQAPDQAQSYLRTFSEQRALALIARNNLVADLANSFLVVAGSKDTMMPRDDNSLAWLYATKRQRAFAKVGILRLERETLWLRRKRIYENIRADAPRFGQQIEDEQWVEGQPYVATLHTLLSRDGWRAAELAGWAAPWIASLRDRASITASGDLMLAGSMLEATPFNAAVDNDGGLRWFDQEWFANEPLPLTYVAWRGLYYSIASAQPTAPSAENWRTIMDITLGVLAEAGLTIDDALVNDFVRREASFQLAVQGGDESTGFAPLVERLRSWSLTHRPANLMDLVLRSERSESELFAVRAHMERELADTRQRVKNIEAILENRTSAYENALQEIKETRDAALEHATSLSKQLEKSELQRQHTEQLLQTIVREHQAIVTSKSWRIMEPLRAFRRGVTRVVAIARRLRPGWRLRIQNQIQTEDGDYSFRSTGDDPQFSIEPFFVRFGRPWVRVQFSMRAEADNLLTPRLYFGTIDGFDEKRAIDLVVDDRGIVDTIVKLLPGSHSMRLDPCVARGRFSIIGFRVKRLTTIGAIIRISLRAIRRDRGRPIDIVRLLKSGLKILRQHGFGVLVRKLEESEQDLQEERDYIRWIAAYDDLNDEDRKGISRRIQHLRQKPLISVLMPVYNVDPRWLVAAIESVRRQLYPNWELCIADDKSTRQEIRSVLEHYRSTDSRIKVCFREQNGHIAASSNSALRLATGDFIALLDHDDELAEHALYLVAEEVESHPEAGLIYSDEDKIDETGHRYDPYFKPDWNPDLFLSQNMISHLGVYRRSLVEAIEGFRLGYEGSQDYDLALRVIEQLDAEQIRHIPHILYHWRSIPGSTALAGEEKAYASKTARNAIEDHLRRRGIQASVMSCGQYCRVKYPIPSTAPLVSLLMPTRDGTTLLQRAVGSVLSITRYFPFELIVIDNSSTNPETLRYLEMIQNDARVRVLQYPHPFNFPSINNAGVKIAQGSIIGLLNDDIEVLHPDWLEEMVSHALRTDIGVVGAMLYYPDETIQHAGVVTGVWEIAAHMHKRLPRGATGYFSRAALVQNYSVVTAACCIVRRSVYEEVGGLDEKLRVAFNDVDFCLRVRERGYRNLWTPFAELYHHESATRGSDLTPQNRARFMQEIEFMKNRWGGKLIVDPAYNPNLSLEADDFSLAYPPRARRPWRDPSRTDYSGLRTG